MTQAETMNRRRGGASPAASSADALDQGFAQSLTEISQVENNVHVVPRRR